MPKVTFIVDGEERILDVDLASLPYSHHGLPGSLLDIAKNLDIPLEHACGGSCACTTCHVIVREGAQNLSEHAGRRGGPPRHGVGRDAAFAPRMPGGRARATWSCEIPMYTRNYVQEGGAIQLGKSARPQPAHRRGAPRGGAVDEVDRLGRHRHRPRREVPGRRPADASGSPTCASACWSSTASRTIPTPRTSRSSRPSRWRGTRSGRTRLGN